MCKPCLTAHPMIPLGTANRKCYGPPWILEFNGMGFDEAGEAEVLRGGSRL